MERYSNSSSSDERERCEAVSSFTEHNGNFKRAEDFDLNVSGGTISVVEKGEGNISGSSASTSFSSGSWSGHSRTVSASIGGVSIGSTTVSFSASGGADDGGTLGYGQSVRAWASVTGGPNFDVTYTAPRDRYWDGYRTGSGEGYGSGYKTGYNDCRAATAASWQDLEYITGTYRGTMYMYDGGSLKSYSNCYSGCSTQHATLYTIPGPAE